MAGQSDADPSLSLASLAVHADDGISAHRAVAPAIHVSSTFRYSDDPDKLEVWTNHDPTAPRDSHIYARDSTPSTTRLEAVLAAVLSGPAVTYASGLAAFHALLVRLSPRRIFIGPGGYHGCAGVARLVQRLSGMEIHPLAAALLQQDSSSKIPPPGKGDLVHVESPINPYGEAVDIKKYVDRAKAGGAWISVDATFAPPPLQNPLALGADVVLHSGTKYIGGHSDMLCGVLAVHPSRAKLAPELVEERLHLGSVMGSLEGWLGLRSLRTVELRVERQSRNAQVLVDWLAAELQSPETSLVAKVVEKIHHASQQPEASDPTSWLRRQMPRGFGPVFAVVMREEWLARRLPSKLALFHHATSLGGVESLVEWRALTDKQIDRRLVRVSVGVEGVEDLKADLMRAFESLVREMEQNKTSSL